ncbi:hypothetical protein ACLMJK_004328 [Lecanora helva]
MPDRKDGTEFASVQACFKSPEYSNLTLLCGNDKYLLHQAILFPRAQFIVKACREKSTAEQAPTIELHGDDPNAVNRMLIFLYSNDYPNEDIPKDQQPVKVQDNTFSSGNGSHAPTTRTSTSKMINHALVRSIAVKYELPSLRDEAQQRFLIALRTCPVTQLAPIITAVSQSHERAIENVSENRTAIEADLCSTKQALQKAQELTTSAITITAMLEGQLKKDNRLEEAENRTDLTSATEKRQSTQPNGQFAWETDQLSREIDQVKQENAHLKQENDQLKQEKARLLKEMASFAHERSLMIELKDRATERHERSLKEKDLAVKEQDRLRKEKDVVVQARDLVALSRDNAKREKDAAIHQKDQIKKERDTALRNSRRWVQHLDRYLENAELWGGCRNCGLYFYCYLERFDCDDDKEVKLQLRCKDCRCRHDLGAGRD